MKKRTRLSWLCVLVLMTVTLTAADFSVSLLGTPDAEASSGKLMNLFDGGKNYSDPSLLFLGSVPQKGCGVVMEFKEATELSKIVVYTAKPNNCLMAPLKTEFACWDEDKQVWQNSESIEDVTGRARETEFTSVSIATEWQASGKPVHAVRIVMTGVGIWLTEIEAFDADGKLLKPSKCVTETRKGAKMYPAKSYLGGVPGNAGAWGKDQRWIGNPNTLNRRDRVVLSFDMGPLIQVGKVQSAHLNFSLRPIGGQTDNRISINMLMPGHRELTCDDLLFGTETFIDDFIFTNLSYPKYRIDVTEQVNALLEEGEAALTLRFRNETIELVGNRNSSAEGAVLIGEEALLEIVK